MADTAAQRHRRKLVGVDIPADQAKAVLEQIGDVLGFHIESLNPRAPLADQMKALAFDCYLQGLMDGQQVRVPPEGGV